MSNSINDLIRIGQYLHQRTWVPATSGNFSVRLNAQTMAITASGKGKGALTEHDFVKLDCSVKKDVQSIDAQCRNNAPIQKKASAETLLHTQLYQQFENVNAVLHVHSVNATLISIIHSDIGRGWLTFQGYEIQKAFSGIDTHKSEIIVPVFANNQDISLLAKEVGKYLDESAPVYGYLIAGHGLYTWGESVEEAVRYLEAFDFLFECELRKKELK